ncbi:uncharacterized protein [Primulina huaijiensis]|uniref:uncharacterized protein n=1 Tax=Primulina huaijiensis TaxID=1492673 RepID=UPI003CC7004D
MGCLDCCLTASGLAGQSREEQGQQEQRAYRLRYRDDESHCRCEDVQRSRIGSASTTWQRSDVMGAIRSPHRHDDGSFVDTRSRLLHEEMERYMAESMTPADDGSEPAVPSPQSVNNMFKTVVGGEEEGEDVRVWVDGQHLISR